MIKTLLPLLLGMLLGWFAHEWGKPVPPAQLVIKEIQTACPEPIQPLAVALPCPVEEPSTAPAQVDTALVQSAVAPPQKENDDQQHLANIAQQIADAYLARDWNKIIALTEQQSNEPTDWAWLLAYGHALLTTDRFQDGLYALNSAYEQHPQAALTVQIDGIIAGTLEQLQQTDKASELALLRLLTTYQSDRLHYWLLLAEALVQQPDLDAAESALLAIDDQSRFGREKQKLQRHIKRLRAMASQQHTAVPLTPYGDHYLVTATINQTHSVTLLLDTGASVTTLSPATISTLNVDLSGAPVMQLNTANGITQAKQFVASTIALGDALLPNVPAGVLSLNTTAFDGLLGMSYLNYYDFYIDQDRHVLHLTPK